METGYFTTVLGFFPCKVKNIIFVWRRACEVVSTHVKWDWNKHQKQTLEEYPFQPDGGRRGVQMGVARGVGPDGDGQGVVPDGCRGQMEAEGRPDGSRGQMGRQGGIGPLSGTPFSYLVPHHLSGTPFSLSGTPPLSDTRSLYLKSFHISFVLFQITIHIAADEKITQTEPWAVPNVKQYKRQRLREVE